jgi:ABC-type xylose transport system permease subunit
VNTFAVLLLAFPFYLMVNGRLTAYTSLVSAAPVTAGTQASGVQTSVQNIAPIA